MWCLFYFSDFSCYVYNLHIILTIIVIITKTQFLIRHQFGSESELLLCVIKIVDEADFYAIICIIKE